MAMERPHPRDGAGGEASASITVPPPRVAFPDAFRNQSNVAPMKLEVEESAEAMSPRNMWQEITLPSTIIHVSERHFKQRSQSLPVYALGGFMVVQWLWARWKERKDRGSA